MDSDHQKCKTMQRYIYVARKDVEEGRRNRSGRRGTLAFPRPAPSRGATAAAATISTNNPTNYPDRHNPTLYPKRHRAEPAGRKPYSPAAA